MPSDFAIDLFRAPPGAPQFEARKSADRAIDAMDLDVMHVAGADPDQIGIIAIAVVRRGGQ